MKRRGGKGGEDEGVELGELERSGRESDDGDEALTPSGDGDHQAADDEKLELGLRARLFNKTNSTVCLLWHVVPMIVMVYAFLYIGTPPPAPAPAPVLRFRYENIRALWNPGAHTDNLQILILNDDTGFNFSSPAFAGSGLVDNATLALLRELPTISAGALVTQELLTNPSTSDIFDWKVMSPDLVDRAQLADCIEHGCAWGALYIPPDFSSTMFEAFGPINITQLTELIFFRNGSYGAYSNPVYFIYDEGRNYATLSIVLKIIDKIFQSVSSGISKKLLTTTLGPLLLQFANPAFFLDPVTLTLTNLHPVHKYGLNFVSYISFVLGWIGSMMTVSAVFSATLPTESKKIEKDLGVLRHIAGVRTLPRRAQFMVVAGWNHILRALWAMMFAFNQSFLITCVVAIVAGDASDDIFYHNFMAFWMWLFYASICFVFINAALASILGITAFQLASTFMLILQLTSGGAVMSEYLMNEFYLIGHGLPFYYAVRGARTILFGSLESKMEENGLVIFGWALGCLLVSFLLSLLRMEKRWMRWQQNERVGQILQSTVGSNATTFVVPPA